MFCGLPLVKMGTGYVLRTEFLQAIYRQYVSGNLVDLVTTDNVTQVKSAVLTSDVGNLALANQAPAGSIRIRVAQRMLRAQYVVLHHLPCTDANMARLALINVPTLSPIAE